MYSEYLFQNSHELLLLVLTTDLNNTTQSMLNMGLQMISNMVTGNNQLQAKIWPICVDSQLLL